MKLHYIFALLLVLAACTSTEPQSGDVPDTEASDVAQDNANENSAVQTSDAEKEFESLFGKRNLQWRIAYDINSAMGDQQSTSQMTQYIKGEDRFRTDMTYEGMESRMYFVEETYTMCTRQNGEWSCFKSEPSDAEDTVDSTAWESEYEENEENYNILADGTKVVAGVTAKCYKIVDESNADAVVRYCFSSDGAPLYMYFSDEESTSEMIATSYSKSVSDNDFTPPAEAQDFGSMYGAGGTMPAGGDFCDYCNQLSGDERDQCLASC